MPSKLIGRRACSHVRTVVPRRLLVRAALRASGFPSP